MSSMEKAGHTFLASLGKTRLRPGDRSHRMAVQPVAIDVRQSGA